MILSVSNQQITIANPNILVSGTVNDGDIDSYWCEFEFTEYWDMFTAKTAVFKKVGAAMEYPILLVDNKCKIPPEVLDDYGYLQIGVFGTVGENVYPTVWSRSLYIQKGCYSEAEYTPTPSIYAQIMEAVSGAVRFDIAQELTDEQKQQALDNIGAGSGGQTDIGLSVINGMIQVTFEQEDIEDGGDN